jgi:hypothetical protein
MKNIVGEALKEEAEAVNHQGSFGTRRCAVSLSASDASEEIRNAFHPISTHYH